MCIVQYKLIPMFLTLSSFPVNHRHFSTKCEVGFMHQHTELVQKVRIGVGKEP